MFTFNLFRGKEKPQTKKIAMPRTQNKVLVDQKVEEFVGELKTRSLGLVGDRIDQETEAGMIVGSINSAIKGSAYRLYNQGRHLALNTSVGARYVQLTIDEVIGTGLQPKTFLMKGNEIDINANAEIENLFWRWASSQRRFSRSGKLNFLECLKLMEKERVMGGDAFLVLHQDGKDLQVTVYGADYVDWNDQRTLENGNVVYGGIEYDQDLKPQAYWFRKRDLFTQAFTTQRYRVPAENVLHYFIPVQADALRGCTDFLPVIKDITHMDAFRETSLIQKRVVASSMCFLEKPQNEKDEFELDDEVDGIPYQEREVITDFSPGTIQELPAGYTVKSVSASTTGDDFDKFNESVLTAISMGLSSYKTALTGDTSTVNYSAAKFGRLMMANRFKGHQDRLIDTVIMPLFEAFLTHSVINSRLNIRMTQIENIMLSMTVIRPKTESIDAAKDISADLMLIQNGLKSRSSVIVSRGEDPIQTFKEIEAERRYLNTFGENEGEQKPDSQIEQPDGG